MLNPDRSTFSFFSPVGNTQKKFIKIDFSSVIAKRGFVPKKLLLLIISKNIHFDDYYSFFNKIISLAS